MIYHISLENFFSIKEEAIVDFIPVKLRSGLEESTAGNVMRYDNVPLLKSIGIFGANASGKSNLLKGIEVCVKMITGSHEFTEASNIGYERFKFRDDSALGKFEIEFSEDGIRFLYGFGLRGNRIEEEHLYYFPKNYKSLIFLRTYDAVDGYQYKFGKGFARPREVVANTSPFNLYLSRAAQMGREIPSKIVKFFRNKVIIGLPVHESEEWQKILTENRERILEALNCADSDICDYDIKVVNENPLKYKLVTYHSCDPSVSFSFDTEESRGTRRLLSVIMAFIKVVEDGKILLVDELESSLHTQLLRYVVELFNSGKKAQLIFTTHDINLIDTTLLRPDQIYFTSKDHRSGGTELYSLADFADYKNYKYLKRDYLQGRFDAVPVLKHMILEA